ncbi:MAG: DUF411 domain-containing protein [Burkholderiales bacterium]|nr:MAG: DUF411 domain-containing protein [Burkholderiales bacterium]
MTIISSRRRALVAAAALLPLAARAQLKTEIEVYKSPTCGCCNDWIKHLQANGFTVKTTSVTDTAPVRARFGLPARYGSCHTAVTAGYVVEGHVPVREIRRLLAERPKAVGIAVPGMPIGSPGMDGPEYKGQKDPYDVVLVLADGSSKVYATYS